MARGGWRSIRQSFLWDHTLALPTFKKCMYSFGYTGSSLQHTGPLILGMWDLVSWPGMEPEPPALGVQRLSH